MSMRIGIKVDAGNEVIGRIIRYVNFFDSLLQQEALGPGQHVRAYPTATPVGMHKKSGNPPPACFHADVEVRVAAGDAEHEPDDLGIRNSDETSAGIKIRIKDDLSTKRVERDFVTRKTEVPQRDDAQLILCFVLPDLG